MREDLVAFRERWRDHHRTYPRFVASADAVGCGPVGPGRPLTPRQEAYWRELDAWNASGVLPGLAGAQGQARRRAAEVARAGAAAGLRRGGHQPARAAARRPQVALAHPDPAPSVDPFVEVSDGELRKRLVAAGDRRLDALSVEEAAARREQALLAAELERRGAPLVEPDPEAVKAAGLADPEFLAGMALVGGAINADGTITPHRSRNGVIEPLAGLGLVRETTSHANGDKVWVLTPAGSWPVRFPGGSTRVSPRRARRRAGCP